jgi:hypothetical protein
MFGNLLWGEMLDGEGLAAVDVLVAALREYVHSAPG